MARQLRVSPSGGEQELIKILADGWDKSEAEVVMDGWRKSLPQQMRDFENFQRLRGSGVERHPLQMLALRWAAGDRVSKAELTEIAHDCGLPVEMLCQMQDCLTKGSKGHANVK